MYYWNPLGLKELIEKGYKLKYYEYDPKLKDQTLEETDAQKEEDKQDSQK